MTHVKGWDVPVDQDTYQKRKAYFKAIFDLEQLQFE